MNKNNSTIEYSNGQTTVLWQPGKCAHSANCVRNLPSVFKPREKPWIKMDGAASEEIVEAISKCPSGALSIKEKYPDNPGY